jgi:hypothetical protein
MTRHRNVASRRLNSAGEDIATTASDVTTDVATATGVSAVAANRARAEQQNADVPAATAGVAQAARERPTANIANTLYRNELWLKRKATEADWLFAAQSDELSRAASASSRQALLHDQIDANRAALAAVTRSGLPGDRDLRTDTNLYRVFLRALWATWLRRNMHGRESIVGHGAMPRGQHGAIPRMFDLGHTVEQHLTGHGIARDAGVDLTGSLLLNSVTDSRETRSWHEVLLYWAWHPTFNGGPLSLTASSS